MSAKLQKLAYWFACLRGAAQGRNAAAAQPGRPQKTMVCPTGQHGGKGLQRSASRAQKKFALKSHSGVV